MRSSQPLTGETISMGNSTFKFSAMLGSVTGG